ncbi:MAG: DUF1987 family protein [Bacteroidia bacterium]|nr:DUF1987 family protein [Bacteroidia bacterium]
MFEISGKSLPENANKIYNPVIEWFEGYSKNPNSLNEQKLKLEYSNSLSAGKLFEIFIIFEQMYYQNKNVKIIWQYSKMEHSWLSFIFHKIRIALCRILII